jgi:hypothetical protein
MNLIDKDALIESLGIETDCYDCKHGRTKYYCNLDPTEVCAEVTEAPVITVTTESAEKAIEVLKNAAWLGAVYSFEETEEAVKTAIRALQVTSAQHNVHDFPKDADCISRADALSCFHDWVDQRGDVHTADEMPEYQRIEQLPDVQLEHPMVDIAKVTMAMAKKADLVAVTRCKDCKHYYYADNRIPQEQRFVCDLEGERWKPDDYCSFAERRTDV